MNGKISRRHFVGLAATTAGAFTIVPAYGFHKQRVKQNGRQTYMNHTSKDTTQGEIAMQLKRKKSGSYPGHWKGRFIWDDKFYPTGKNLYRMFRTTIDLPEKEIVDATLRITAADKFSLYVNGYRIGHGPCRSLMPQWMFYDEIDLKEQLAPGKNTLATMVFWHGLSNGFAANQRSGFFFEWEILFQDGTIVRSVSDESVKTLACYGWSTDAPLVNGFQGIMVEDYDAVLDPSDWTQIDFDDSAWEQSSIISVKNDWGFEKASCWEYMEPRLTPMLKEVPVSPEQIVQTGRTKGAVFVPDPAPVYDLSSIVSGELRFLSNKDGDPYFILDFGRPRNAVPWFRVDAPQGLHIDLAWDHKVERIGGNKVGRFEAYYKTRDGLQQWHPFHVTTADTRFLRVTFRTGNQAVTLKDIKYIAHEYPAQQIGSFRCSDPVITRLWQACTDTVWLHLQDSYIMDPSRERAYYMLAGEMEQCHMNYYVAFGDIAATATHFKLMTHYQLGDGKFGTLLIPSDWRGFAIEEAPKTSPAYSMIPAYSVYYAEAVRRRYKHFPDLSFYREQYASLLKLADFLERHTDENNLLYNLPPLNWHDWPLFQKWDRELHNGAILGFNAGYVGFCNAMSEILAEMGYEKDSHYWAEKKQLVRQAIEKHFWDEEMGLFRDFYNTEYKWQFYSELMNCSAINHGVGTKEQHTRIMDTLKRRPENVTPASPLYYHYVMEAFYKTGEAAFITQDCADRYRPVVEENNFPTLPEEWPDPITAKTYGDTASAVHGGGSGVAYSFTTHIAGITPMTDGFKKISFRCKT